MSDFPPSRRQCLAYWCLADAAVGTILCQRHHDMLPVELRSQVRAALATAVGYVASLQMRAAFEKLPEETKALLREEAKKL
jgi:hypothetical protein